MASFYEHANGVPPKIGKKQSDSAPRSDGMWYSSIKAGQSLRPLNQYQRESGAGVMNGTIERAICMGLICSDHFAAMLQGLTFPSVNS